MAKRPSPRAFFSNWKDSDLPLTGRAAAAVRNNLKKLRTGSSCCGNYGEPGC